MVIFLYGPDAYRLEQKKYFYVKEFSKKYSSYGVAHLDLSTPNALQELDLMSRSVSLFESAKLILASNFLDVLPKKLNQALEIFWNNKKINIILTADKKPTKSFDFLNKEPALSFSFDYLEGNTWLKFIQQEASKNKVVFSSSALNFLAKIYIKNSWGLVTEVQKFSYSENSIEVMDIVASNPYIAAEFFPTIQALRSLSLSNRLVALQTLFKDNEPAAKIFNLIAALWLQRINQMAAYDEAVKMGRIEYEEALTDLILSA